MYQKLYNTNDSYQINCEVLILIASTVSLDRSRIRLLVCLSLLCIRGSCDLFICCLDEQSFVRFFYYSRYPIVARALGLAAECAREQMYFACKVF